jgi:NADPH2:quinone reductase
VGQFYVKDCSVHGFAMFNASPDQQRRAAEDINRWTSEGKFKANIGREMPLAETAAAHRLQEENTIHGAGTLSGKIVLTP